MRRNVALLLIASRAWAECSSHDDCVGYCRAYSSSNYCRSCGDCMYDGITQWVTADPIDGVCPSRCEELPTLYDNGTLAVFNAATVAVNLYVGLNSEASCDSSDPGTSLLFSDVPASTWVTTTTALYRMDDRFGDWNYYCVVPTDPSSLANSSRAARPSIVFVAAFEESDSSSLGICASSTTLSGAGADYMRVMVANTMVANAVFTPDDMGGGYYSAGSGIILDFGITDDIVNLMDMYGSISAGSERLNAAYTGADGAQVELAAYDFDEECGLNGCCSYVCADGDASANVDVAYGSVMGCAVYETSERLMSCLSFYGSGVYYPTASPTLTQAPTFTRSPTTGPTRSPTKGPTASATNSGEVSSAVRSTLATGVFAGVCVAGAFIAYVG